VRSCEGGTIVIAIIRFEGLLLICFHSLGRMSLGIFPSEGLLLQHLDLYGSVVYVNDLRCFSMVVWWWGGGGGGAEEGKGIFL